MPNHLELAEAFQAQRDAEKACVVDLRDAEKESEDIVKNRTKEEQNIELLTPYYDVVRINQEDDEEDEEEEKQTLDYLSPFLPPLLAGQEMSAKEAAATRDAYASRRSRTDSSIARTSSRRDTIRRRPHWRSARPTISEIGTC